ncbi:hypothetical protein [Pontibacter harenae]|uniref:hypothetical protein n=1 Tax=Pontibacter harenae TaxID=2894083 RepID=UPI001E2C740D|nr:hypothetical protein [Pontibacter harenae]MCC9165440.1 hypothetical protein [Pontibacter harenae]
MLKYKNILYAFFLLAIAACERPTPPATGEAALAYDINGFIAQQVQHLEAQSPTVLKTVQTEGQPAETIKTDSVNWEEELAVFQEVDVNRPAVQEFYTEQKTQLSNGNTSVKYNRVEGAEAPVAYLHLILRPDNQIQHLEAVLQDQNPLFYTKRTLSLTTDANTTLQSYSIEGVQKLILNDSLHYSVSAKL